MHWTRQSYMRCLFLLCCLVLCGTAWSVSAQEPAKLERRLEGNAIPTDVVCHSEAAMRKVMESGDPEVMTKLIRSGDCLLVSDEAIKDASLPAGNSKGPAKVTVETRRGIVQLWGYYVF